MTSVPRGAKMSIPLCTRPPSRGSCQLSLRLRALTPTTGIRSCEPLSGGKSASARVASSLSRADFVAVLGAIVGLRTISRLVKRLRSARSCALSCVQSSSSAAGGDAAAFCGGGGAGANGSVAHPLRKRAVLASTLPHVPTHHLRALRVSMRYRDGGSLRGGG